MKDVTPIPAIPTEQAKIQHRRYCDLLKTHPSDHAQTLKDAYYALSKGKTIIDIYQAFKTAGKYDNDRPKIAIARAHLPKIVFQRRRKGSGAFWSPEAWEWFGASQWGEPMNASIALPNSIFTEWINDKWRRNDFYHETAQTVVPTVPAEFYPKGQLKRYFILWEVEEDGWEPVPEPPGDPMLLKRISRNLFTVLAAWDTTELEKAVLRGAIM